MTDEYYTYRDRCDIQIMNKKITDLQTDDWKISRICWDKSKECYIEAIRNDK